MPSLVFDIRIYRLCSVLSRYYRSLADSVRLDLRTFSSPGY